MSNTVKLNTCPKCKAPIPAAAPQGLCPRCVLLGAATATETGVPATATSEIPSLERISAAFPQLEVLELIGRGGMGFVFKARQPHLDRLVALKLLPDKLAKDALFAERFNREGRVLAKLNHPNITSVFDFGHASASSPVGGPISQSPDPKSNPLPGFYYLLMEYVDGVNLRQAMRAGRFSPAEALALVPKVCEALQYAHEQGILHRDIKPENILLDTKGRVKIADFGIAKLVGEDQENLTLTNTGASLGTPHYMAPEQFEKPATVDHRADIYSLGVVFYEMLTGELPIGRFAAPSAKTPVNTSVDEVVFRTLEKDRELRFQSAGEMRTQVEHLGEGANAAAQASPTRTEHEERSYSRWSIYGALSVGLSLPVPFATIVALISGRAGIGPAELWLALGSVALPGLGGTLLGWLGLNEIRESRGRVRGLPLAMFATMFWPLTILGAVTIGVPISWAVPDGEPTTASTIGRFLVLLLPATVFAFGFWAIHATARWAGQQQVVQQRGVLKWVFIAVLLIGINVVLVTNPGQRRAASPLPAQSGKSAALPAAKTKVVALSLFKNQRDSIFLTTTSPLGPDEALVPILERPDGRREMGQFITHFARENNRTQERATAIWSWEKDGSYPGEEAHRIETLLEENVVGRPLTLVAGQPLHLFSLTNRVGGVLRCHLDYQPDFAENAYRSTESDQAMVRVEQGIVSSGSSSTLILFLQPSIPPGHSLQPLADGTIGTFGHSERTISLSSSRPSFTCNWRFPASFTSNDVFSAQAQCEKLRQSPPFAVRSGGRQLLFAVTNQAGEIHRGYLELTKSKTAPTITTVMEAAPMIQFTFTSVELREEAAARWLTMEYVEQVRGNCERTFRYDARVPGFTAQTRMDSAMSDTQAGFAPVLHQRVLWKLPDSLPPAEALALRDLVAKEWMGKPTAIEPGDERVLFKTLLPNGGTLATAIGVKLKHEDASQNAQSEVVPPPSPNSRVASPSANNSGPAAELWSPKLAPGEKPNVSEILQEAKRLTDSGRYEEALQRHIWYHNHALEIQPSQVGVRLSFALSYWTELAQRYPKAKEALNEILDQGTQAFAKGEGRFALFMEVSAINRQLGRQKETLVLFESIQSQDPKLARQCYGSAEDLLVENGEYALCESFIPDFQKRFETLSAGWQRTLSDRNPEANRTSLREHVQRTFIKDTRKLVEILVGVSRNTEAEAIRDQGVALLDEPEMRSAMTDAEQKVASHSVAPAKP